MLPPPPPPGSPAGSPAGPTGTTGPGPRRQNAGLLVLAVALVVLLGLIALVWYINEQESDNDDWRSSSATADIGGATVAIGSPT